jgi:Peptidase family M1 domain
MNQNLRLLLLPAFMWLAVSVFGQAPGYFQQDVAYVIDAKLDDKNNMLTANWQLTYKNNSTQTLDFIYIHVWPNAYRNRKTAYAKQELRNSSLSFHQQKAAEYGGISELDFKVNGMAAQMVVDPKFIDVVKVMLPTPLKPGQSAVLTTPFVLDIPNSTSRLGHVGQSYQMTQWYPKPAVFDSKGWHNMPYLDQGEFYSEYGTFDITLTLPANYVVGATGELQTASEREFLAQKVAESTELLAKDSENPKDTIPASSDKTKTIRYTTKDVHDFAWFADKRFYVQKSVAKLASGRTVDTWAMFTNVERDLWKEGVKYVTRAVEFYSENVGEYPYSHATAVMSALSAGGGMEYPMITVIGKSSSAQNLDIVITHEVGHNWFYGILGSNERDHPWMDEGMNSFYEQRYTRQYYGGLDGALPGFLTMGREIDNNALLWEVKAHSHDDQAPDTHSEELESLNYGLAPYMKPALSMLWLENYIGKEAFDAMMKAYFVKWKFKHPYPEDYRNHITASNQGRDVSWFMDELMTTDHKPDYGIKSVTKTATGYDVTVVNKGETATPFPLATQNGDKTETVLWVDGFTGTKTVSMTAEAAQSIIIDPKFETFDLRRDNNYSRSSGFMPKIEPIKLRLGAAWDNPERNTLYVLPFVFVNRYDRVMPVLGLHNGFLPTKRLNWGVFPAYSFNSKAVRGLATAAYQWFPDNKIIHKIRIGADVSRFGNQYPVFNSGRDFYTRKSPFISVGFAHKNNGRKTSSLTLRNTSIQRYIYTEYDVEAPFISSNSLEYKYNDPHVLHPRRIMAKFEMYKVETTSGRNNGNRLFLEFEQDYSVRKKAYASLRLFAGLGLNNTSLPFGITGHGVFDATNDQYFFGRNQANFDVSNQVSKSGGGLKLPYIVGDNKFSSYAGVLAANFSFPVPVKRLTWIRPYFDIAVNLDEDDSPNQTIWASGVSLSFFKRQIEIYIPVIDSNPFSTGNRPTFMNSIMFKFEVPVNQLFNGGITGSQLLGGLM